MTPWVILPLFENFGISVEEKNTFWNLLKKLYNFRKNTCILFHFWDRVFNLKSKSNLSWSWLQICQAQFWFHDKRIFKLYFMTKEFSNYMTRFCKLNRSDRKTDRQRQRLSDRQRQRVPDRQRLTDTQTLTDRPTLTDKQTKTDRQIKTDRKTKTSDWEQALGLTIMIVASF